MAKVTDFYENQDVGNFASSLSTDKYWIGKLDNAFYFHINTHECTDDILINII